METLEITLEETMSTHLLWTKCTESEQDETEEIKTRILVRLILAETRKLEISCAVRLFRIIGWFWVPFTTEQYTRNQDKISWHWRELEMNLSTPSCPSQRRRNQNSEIRNRFWRKQLWHWRARSSSLPKDQQPTAHIFFSWLCSFFFSQTSL